MAVRRSGNGAPPKAAPPEAAPPKAAPRKAAPPTAAAVTVPAKAKLAEARAAEPVTADHVSAPRAAKATGRDMLLVTGPTEDGKGLSVLRAKDDTVQIGAVHPLEEGKPIHGEVVKLKQRSELPGLFDVESQFGGQAAAAQQSDGGPSAPARRPMAQPRTRPTSAGPAQVATDTYRSGWDRIYRRTNKRDLPN